MTIIETNAGQTFCVIETGNADTAHVWLGVEVKRTRAGWATKAKAREILVRKAGCRVIEKN